MYKNQEEDPYIRNQRVREEALDSILRTNKSTRAEFFLAIDMIMMLDAMDEVDEDLGSKYGPLFDRLYTARNPNEDRIDAAWSNLFDEQHRKKMAIIKRILSTGEV